MIWLAQKDLRVILIDTGDD